MRVKVRRAAPGLWLFSCPCGYVSPVTRSFDDAVSIGHRHAWHHTPPAKQPEPPAQQQRYRCTVVGCNPVLWGEADAELHASNHGHRIAKWPVRSAEGKRRAKARNRSGYYDKYNVGAKSAHVRLGRSRSSDWGDDSHPFSPEALGQ